MAGNNNMNRKVAVRIHFMLSRETLRQIDRFAQQQNRTRGNLIALWIERMAETEATRNQESA